MSGVYSTDEMEQAETVTVTAAEPAKLPKVDTTKTFVAGKAAIAKAKSLQDLEELQPRMAARLEAGEITQKQHDELLQLMLEKETEIDGTVSDD
jgi:hypothetical protein